MSKFESPLDNIRIASPCSSDWDEMYGDERKRFCGECKLNVYNLSGMTKDEAEALVMNAEGRLCVRFYRRADGSVITEDCPVGWAKVKQRTKLYATAAASLLMALFTGVLFVSLFSKQRPLVGERLMGAIAVPPTNALQGKPIMGNFAIDMPTPAKKPEKKFEIGKMRVIEPHGQS